MGSVGGVCLACPIREQTASLTDRLHTSRYLPTKKLKCNLKLSAWKNLNLSTDKLINFRVRYSGGFGRLWGGVHNQNSCKWSRNATLKWARFA